VQILAWDDRGRRALAPVAIQSPRGQELLATVPQELRLKTAHVDAPDGTVRSGGDAVAVLSAVLPGAAPYGLVARLLPWLVRGGYGVIAANRITVSRAVPKAAKARADAALARRSAPGTTA
jgi:predicted DCC family thiol-disulfide oxidoreductase YuxK